MQFGKVAFPELIDFSMPYDHVDTSKVLAKAAQEPLRVYVGCAKWNRQDLKGFYPRGIKDELTYYSRQFNSIELNATFYRNFSAKHYETWYDKTPNGFKFFPKLVQNISHFKRLNDQVQPYLEAYLTNVIHLKEKLGTLFLQMHENFAPKDFDRVVRFVEKWPKELKLAMEFRHTAWFNDVCVAQELYALLEENKITNILVDTAGRRDILHMRLTTSEAFIRYVGTEHESDYLRLDDWVLRLKAWRHQGLNAIYFFVHQHIEVASPLLSEYFIEKLNAELGLALALPASKPLELF